MFDDARAADTPTDAWPRLRAQIAARKRRSWAPGTITGLVTGAALVTALLLPTAGRLGAHDYLADAGSARLESLRLQPPGARDLDLPGVPVHVERVNVAGFSDDITSRTHEVFGPFPDRVRPVTATTTSPGIDRPAKVVVRPA